MNSPEPTDEERVVTSEGYRITVDEGRESFYAICIEERDNDEAWVMSDTAYALENMR